MNNKQTLIRYCNASFFLISFEMVRLIFFVNILSIISTLLPSASRRCCYCWRLVSVVGISNSATRCQSRSRRRLVVISVLSLSAALSFIVAASVVF